MPSSSSRLTAEVTSRTELLAAGWSRGEIQSAVRRGDLHRIAPGLYSAGLADRQHPHFRIRAALARFGPDAALTHESAAAVWGLRESRVGEPVHIAIRHGRLGRTLSGVEVHQTVAFESTRHAGYPIVSPRQALVHLAAEADVDRLRFPALAAVQRGVVSTAELTDPTGVPRRSLGRWREVAEESVAGAESGGEGRYWRLLRRSGLPLPALNQLIGTVAGYFRLDAWWRQYGLVAEIDGRRYHSREPDFERDRVRQNAIHACGLVVIRFPVSQVLAEPQTVLSITYQNMLARCHALGVRPPKPPMMPDPS